MNENELIKKLRPDIDLPPMSTYMRDWASWYKGSVNNFHNYRIYNGTNSIDIEMKSMQMGKVISEKWADLLMNERVQFVIKEEDQDKLDTILDNNNFWYRINNSVERAFAIGLSALYVTVNDLEVGNKGTLNKTNSKLKINFADAFKIKPITIDNGEITECAFISNKGKEKTVVIHLKEGSQYVIYSYMLLEGNLKAEDIFYTKSDSPYFFIIRPNIANNLNDDYDYDATGISVLANAIDGLKSLDAFYDSFFNEIVLKRPRIFLSEKAYKVDIESGDKIKSFDPRATEFFYLSETEDGKKHIETTSDTLRTNEIIESINAQLNYVGMRCGFGQKFFKFDITGQVTATQVVSENSTLFRSIKKHELLLESILRKFILVLIQASNDFTATTFITKIEEIKILFDDSIIEDKTALKAQDKADVESGLMSKVEYRMKWYGEDKETAEKNIRDYFLYEIIDNYIPALTQGAMTPRDFVEKVYGEEDEEKITYITQFINSGSFKDFNEMEFGEEEEEEEADE